MKKKLYAYSLQQKFSMKSVMWEKKTSALTALTAIHSSENVYRNWIFILVRTALYSCNMGVFFAIMNFNFSASTSKNKHFHTWSQTSLYKLIEFSYKFKSRDFVSYQKQQSSLWLLHGRCTKKIMFSEIVHTNQQYRSKN